MHRYTIRRLRAEIEPVSAADFMRFLFRWQHVDPATRLTGADGLREAIAILDGYEMVASAWERAVLPCRVDRYDPSMLDMLCLTGEAGWGRLSIPNAAPTSISTLAPSTPIALFLREHGERWLSLVPESERQDLSQAARDVEAILQARGALFFSGLLAGSGLDADQLQHALGALVACGLATSDGFSGFRALARATAGRPPVGDRRAAFSGRWTLARGAAAVDREDAVQLQALTLLKRYGIICRRLLIRETNAAPWRELTRIYRRLEARGEIRGGRFVAGFSGEQFALPDAVERMREVRRTPPDGQLIAISTADPLNLAGIVTPGERVRAASRNRLVYRDGQPIALFEGGQIRELTALDPATRSQVAMAIKARRPALTLA
jgi:ATP-dependent Lhr-like helicase